MATEINLLQPLQVQPNPAQLQPGQRPTTLTFYLRAQPAVFSLLVPGTPNNLSVVTAPLVLPVARVVAKPGSFLPLLPTNPALVQTQGLVHTRALGAPKVNTQLRPSGQAHARALGSLTVIPPPVVPPVIPPPTPSAEPAHTPRNLRYVERRNKPRRN